MFEAVPAQEFESRRPIQSEADSLPIHVRNSSAHRQNTSPRSRLAPGRCKFYSCPPAVRKCLLDTRVRIFSLRNRLRRPPAAFTIPDSLESFGRGTVWVSFAFRKQFPVFCFFFACHFGYLDRIPSITSLGFACGRLSHRLLTSATNALKTARSRLAQILSTLLP